MPDPNISLFSSRAFEDPTTPAMAVPTKYRAFERQTVKGQVFVIRDSDPMQTELLAAVVDLSQASIAVVCSHALPVNERVRIRPERSPSRSRISCYATVSRILHPQSEQPIAICTFERRLPYEIFRYFV